MEEISPNIVGPKTSPSFMEPTKTIPSKLTVNFVLPYHDLITNKEVDMVTIPATSGQMGVSPSHVSAIEELKPGLLSVHKGSDVKKYFVSGGFACIHGNSLTDILCLEAIPLDHKDPNLVRKGLAEFSEKVSSASTDKEKVQAQIGVEVHNALDAALSG